MTSVVDRFVNRSEVIIDITPGIADPDSQRLPVRPEGAPVARSVFAELESQVMDDAGTVFMTAYDDPEQQDDSLFADVNDQTLHDDSMTGMSDLLTRIAEWSVINDSDLHAECALRVLHKQHQRIGSLRRSPARLVRLAARLLPSPQLKQPRSRAER